MKISFTIPDKYGEDLKQWLPDDIRLSDFFKACAINRMIDRGICDEFGYPHQFPTIDISNGLNLTDIKEVCTK